MEYEKLELNITDGQYKYSKKVDIDVPKVGKYYYININGSQQRVKLEEYVVSLGVLNQVFVMARVCDREHSSYATDDLNIIFYDVMIKDLFTSKDKARDYYLDTRKNASIIKV